MDEAEPRPLCHQRGGALADGFVQREIAGLFRARNFGEMVGCQVVEKRSERFRLLPGRQQFKMPKAQEALRHPTNDGAGLGFHLAVVEAVAQHAIPGRQQGEGPGGGDAKGRHGLAAYVFSKG